MSYVLLDAYTLIPVAFACFRGVFMMYRKGCNGSVKMRVKVV
jgi:hypothetical protein